jgi:hypothetical protein
MAFSDFKYPDVIDDLGLIERSVADLFPDVPPVAPSAALAASLPGNVRLATTAHSEASRSTWMVGPVLADFWNRYNGRISLFAGIEFSADEEAGLSGYVDFIIGRSNQLPQLRAPVVFLVEAKRDSIPGGLGQCVAGMVGMRRFNAHANKPIDPLYGLVTTGSLWRFLKLSGNELTIDLNEYLISQTDKILGILTHIVQPDRPAAAA